MAYVEILCSYWERHYLPDDVDPSDLDNEELIKDYIVNFGEIEETDFLIDTSIPYFIKRPSKEVMRVVDDNDNELFTADGR